MHIFALETDLGKLKQSVMGKRDEEVMTIRRHWLPVAFVMARDVLLGSMLIVIGVLLNLSGAAVALMAILWLVWTVSGLLRAFIDLRFTFLFLTREKIVIVRQHLFRRRMMPITLNNIQSVEVESQYWDLLGFGKLHIFLRDTGEILSFSYVSEPSRVAKRLTNVVSLYNQRIGVWDKMGKTTAPAGI
jgi:Bacterial PH domain